jgi:hypothetical protein
MAEATVDITPTPRVLRTLGDIPFDAWQALAELADNGIDALSDAARKGIPIENPKIEMHWSSEDIPGPEREVVVRDNGPGMTLETLQDAARAGYSSNEPINTLGLFGMGFNIATARLGDQTEFLSTTEDSNEWLGIRISFEDLIKAKQFAAPVIRRRKEPGDISGTMIVVSRLKPDLFAELKKQERTIRRRLESIYSPILVKKTFEMFVQGKKLEAQPPCVWSESRYVVRRGEKISAIQQLDRDLGETFFDLSRNRYVTDQEAAEIEVLLSNGEEPPSRYVKRSRRLRGWLGVQRYSDPSDFGIDFVRNGRKILVQDKSLFGHENPDTGTMIQEYPVELGSTVGGRLVGEIHVDYLIPTYQKNGFDTSDRAWRLTVEALRGAGPILPKKRKALGYADDNSSPIGRLVNAYRRVDPGTKCLAIANSIAKRFYEEFKQGNPDYEGDEKWFKAAQEADRERGEGGGTTPVDSGSTPSDDVNDFEPGDAGKGPDPEGAAEGGSSPPPPTSTFGSLVEGSEKTEHLCGKYAYGARPGFDVTARKVNGQHIRLNGKRMPSHLCQDGIDLDFFFDPTHPLLAEFPITPKQLLLQALAERFSLRDTGVPIQEAFIGLVENHLGEERINLSALQERAMAMVGNIKDRLPTALGHRFQKAVEVIREVESEEEELAKRLLDEAPQLLQEYQDETANAVQALAYVADETIPRLVRTIPEEFLDGKVFTLPYESLSIGSEAARERLRAASVEKAVAYLRDTILLLRIGMRQSKQELLRHANTLSILEDLLG